MPEKNPEPGPDQPAGSEERPTPSTEIAAWSPTPQGAPYPAEMPPFARIPMPWEPDEAPEEARLPGTRRLWLAGGLAIAVLIATATAIAVLDNGTDTPSQERANRPASDTDVPFIPGVSAAATEAAVAPSGKTGLSSPAPAASPKPSGQGSDNKPVTPAPKPTASSKPSASATASALTSVQSVNYPDRYWRVSNSVVGLDQVSSQSSAAARQNSSFKRVKGLADPSCYSFVTVAGNYLRHREFVLRAEHNSGSDLFKKDATFCPRPTSTSGAIMLESVNYPGRYLHHDDFQLRLDSPDGRDNHRHDRDDREDWTFRLVKGLGNWS